ncbi:probable E3 ubiquitin-protein ligase makorin-1 [Centrocercus urophasianus]|uniref:probable E3 ubiquitin-protein ligase makorin-1 n=1 Tax=Centrocercus urophasianus TaxID=9002 RepID=UPI001C64F297|nr:probable E3 ubiquitin-protein ligase makorin-1 [Centrocercus urophasianus]
MEFLPFRRNFARGSCRFGQRCRFSHGTKVPPARHRAPGDSQHDPEQPLPAVNGRSPVHPRRGGSEQGAVVRSRGGAGHSSAASATRAAFGLPRAEEEDGTENIPASGDPPGCAVRGGFGSARARSAAGSHLKGLRPDPSSPAPSKAVQTAWAQCSEDPIELGAAAAPVSITDLRARSEAVVCGICMERVFEKALPEERLFGILPNCSHAFCLGCIRTWRRSRDFPKTVSKACPECRLTSTYYIPHKFWLSDGDEKQQLIESFKARTGQIRCKFFTRNHGRCPFGSDCIYLHELPIGRTALRHSRQRLRMRAERSPSPLESSDEEEDEFYLLEWAVTSALLELELLYTSYSHGMFFEDISDSD